MIHNPDRNKTMLGRMQGRLWWIVLLAVIVATVIAAMPTGYYQAAFQYVMHLYGLVK